MALTITKDLTSNGVSLTSVFVSLNVKGKELVDKLKVELNYYVNKDSAMANLEGSLKGVEGLPSNVVINYSRQTNGTDIQAFVNEKIKEYLVANTDLEDGDIIITTV